MSLQSKNALPILILCLMGLFILTVGITANYVFIDEVYFLDPVINYLNGDGYITTAWNITKQCETHVSTAPAYSLLLILWLKLFGISHAAVRILPAVLALLSALVFWRSCLRSGLIKSGIAGAVVICVLILDYGFAFSYTSGRPDSLSALLVAVLFYLSTLQDKRVALFSMGAVSVLLPFVQWGCVIYLVLLSGALFLILRKEALKYMLVVCACMVAGLLVQKAVYSHFGIWDTWIATIKSEGSESITQRIGYRMTLGALRHHSNAVPKEFSSLVILLGMAFVAIRSKILRQQEGLIFAKSAWITASTIILGMYLLGKFPTYYGWMLGFPLAAILASYFEKSVQVGRSETAIAASITLLACGVGLPMQACLASHDWTERKSTAITPWLESKISKDDVVYCDYPFYYTAKERAKTIFTGRYCSRLTPEEFNSITLAIIGTNGSDWASSKYSFDDRFEISTWSPSRSGILGNNWKYGILSAPNYSCTVYKLKEKVKP